MDQVVEVKEVSFWSRLKDSFKNIGGGFLLIIIGMGLLYRNEGRSVQTAASLGEIKNIVVSVDSQKVDPANENKLVHTVGDVVTKDPIADSYFGIDETSKAVKLIRNVQMYQRQESQKTETKDKVGGGQTQTTTYNYNLVWSDKLIDSTAFKEQSGHKNPTAMGYEGKDRIVKSATVGAFNLNEEQIGAMNRTEPYEYSQESFDRIPNDAEKDALKREGNSIYVSMNTNSSSANPKVGDLRISRDIVRPSTVSLIAQQNGQTFRPYQTKAGDAISMVEKGNVSPAQMIANAESANVFMTWILRILGIGMIVMGFNMILSILVTIGSIIPVIGRVVNAGVGLVSGVIGTALGLIVIAIAWIASRPVVAIILIIVAIGATVWLYITKKKSTTPSKTTPSKHTSDKSEKTKSDAS